ncbi:hypothetical protein PoMZ_11563 [Pyricularia oryzae]|uniref:Uncharacterized protein n=1 Tax=Pyricularia oryzae TaxID=318829 RepID=A0A4V1C7A2_PYROR|nr:hypothetical protein PoMZ_11563 [Pyricularia oryzae]
MPAGTPAKNTSYYAIDRLISNKPPAHYRHALPWPADKPDPDRRAGEQSKPVTPCNFFGPFRALRHELLTKGRGLLSLNPGTARAGFHQIIYGVSKNLEVLD